MSSIDNFVNVAVPKTLREKEIMSTLMQIYIDHEKDRTDININKVIITTL